MFVRQASSVLEPGLSQGIGEARPPPTAVELPPATHADLLDPALWHETLEMYARTTNLAVALADAGGRLLGECIEPQPTWRWLHARQAAQPEAAGGCPFALAPSRPCTCVADALAKGAVVMAHDRTGLAHFAVPLALGEHHFGALVAGQVFTTYPEQLPLEHVARQLGLSPGKVWELARLEHPVKLATLYIYAALLATLGLKFLQTRYHTLQEAERLAEMTRLRDLALAEMTGRKRVEEGQRFLLEASAEFASRDYETTLKRLASRVVPFLADFCFFDVVSPDETIQRVGWAHADPAKQELFDHVNQFVPPPHSHDHPVAKVLRTGHFDFEPEVTDAWMESVATSPQHLELMRDLEVRSLMTVPMIVHERRLGALTFGYTAASGRRHTVAELRLAEDLAHRAAMVVENAGLYRELQEADHHKDEFLAMLAHELRNPLAPIHNVVELFRLKGLADPELQWGREVVERQVQQLTRLVDDLLDVSRISRGKINLRMEPVDLAAVVARAVEMSRPLIDTRKHHLEIALPGQGVWVQGDPARLAQIVSNLLNNAAKFTEVGGRIDLTVAMSGDQAILRVRDTGVGLAPAMLAHVFDLFTQVQGSVSRSEGGLGIGLTLVRSLVEMHGGSVLATSAGLGQGSEFVVRLPLLAAPPAPVHAAEQPPEVPRKVMARSILVVDDNQDTAETLALLLRLGGHEVRIAYDGPTALDSARGQPPDMVLCDIGLPGMSGLEVARQLRREPGMKDALLLALTGYGQEADRLRSQEAGFNAHLVKPVDLDALQILLAQAASPAPGTHEVN